MPGYTIKLTMPKVATKPNWVGGAGCCGDSKGVVDRYCSNWGHFDGGRQWFLWPRLFGRRCDEGLGEETKAMAGVEEVSVEETESCSWAS